MEETPVIWEFEIFVVLAYLAKAGVGTIEDALEFVNKVISFFDKLVGDRDNLSKFSFSNQKQAEDALEKELGRVIACVLFFSLRLQIAREVLKDD